MKMVEEYRAFLMRGNVIDLAVGVVAGAAFGTVVNSLVTDVITPLVAGLFGKPDFAALRVQIGEAQVQVGLFLNAVIAFLLTMTAVFFLIVKPLALVTQRFGPAEKHPAMRECPECLSSVRAAARRCAQCTAAIEPVTRRGAT